MEETKENYNRFVSVGYFLEEFVQHQGNKSSYHLANKERCFVVEKVFSFTERAERVGKY